MSRDYFGKQVRVARRAREMSQWELARRVGKSPAYVCNLELGNIQVQAGDKVRKRFIRALGLGKTRAA